MSVCLTVPVNQCVCLSDCVSVSVCQLTSLSKDRMRVCVSVCAIGASETSVV